MKKLFYILFFFLIFIKASAQHPIGTDSFALQTLGSSNTLVESKGGLTSIYGIIHASYADTATANLSKIKNYPGAEIRTGDILWIRNSTATAWLEISSSSPSYASLFFDATLGGGFYNPGDLDRTIGVDTVNYVFTNYRASLLGFTGGDTTILANADFTIDSLANNEPGTPSAGHNVLVWTSPVGSDFLLNGNNIAQYDGTTYHFIHPANGATARTNYENPPLNEKAATYQYDSAHDVWNLLSYAALQNGNYQNADLNVGTRTNNAFTQRTNNITRDSTSADGKHYMPSESGVPYDNYYSMVDTTTKEMGFREFSPIPYDGISTDYWGGDSAFHPLPSGGSGSTDYVNSGLGIKVDSTGRNYTVNLDTAYTNSLYGGGDTSTFAIPIDSTGQSAGRIIWSKPGYKLGSSPSFLYSDSLKKMVLGSTNISIGGNSTKLWVTGGAIVSGKLGVNVSNPTNTLHVNGDVRISTIANGTAGTDSVLVVNGGVIKKAAGNSYLIPSDTIGKFVTNIRRQAGSTTVEKQIGGSWTTAFTDSTGSGGGDSTFKRLTWINAQDWGILPSNSEATNTANATLAIAYLKTHGGGTLFFQKADSAYKVQIIIPAVSSDSICNIRILGATPPEQRAGTVGDNTSNPLPKKGVILKSSSTTAGTGVIYVSANSYVTVTLQNLDIRTYDNPQISGVELNSGNRFFIDNCTINTDIYNKSASLPTHVTYGIRTPQIGNGANLYITNTTISGYYIGLNANEHTTGNDVNFYSCVRALQVETSPHAIHFGRISAQACNTNIYAIGSAPVYIDEIAIEHIDSLTESTPSTAWMVTQFDVKDTANLLSGNINYWAVLGGSGAVDALKQSGGLRSKLLVQKLGLNPATDIMGATGTQIVQITNSSNSTTGSIFEDANSVGFGAKSNSYLNLFANNSNFVCLSPLGGFGLGNSSGYNASATIPQGVALIQNKLSVGTTATTDVNGATVIQAVGPRATDILSLSDGTTKFGFFIDNTSATPGLFGTISNHSFGVFTNNGGAQQKWYTSGNTSIGSTSDNGSKLQVNGSVSFAYVAKSTSYTATASDHTIEVTATGQTITLPTAASITGRFYTIKLTASGSATVATTSSQTIDGSTTYSLSAQYKYVTVQSNGSNWIIIANN